MELDAILAALEEYNDRTFPREALAQAIAHKEEITPLLLDVCFQEVEFNKAPQIPASLS